MSLKPLFLIIFSCLSLSGCMASTTDRAVIGGGIGLGVGAVTGNVGGAIAGAAIGAAVGAATGI